MIKDIQHAYEVMKNALENMSADEIFEELESVGIVLKDADISVTSILCSTNENISCLDEIKTNITFNNCVYEDNNEDSNYLLCA